MGAASAGAAEAATSKTGISVVARISIRLLVRLSVSR